MPPVIRQTQGTAEYRALEPDVSGFKIWLGPLFITVTLDKGLNMNLFSNTEDFNIRVFFFN